MPIVRQPDHVSVVVIEFVACDHHSASGTVPATGERSPTVSPTTNCGGCLPDTRLPLKNRYRREDVKRSWGVRPSWLKGMAAVGGFVFQMSICVLG